MCGGLDHKRRTSHLCPFNPNYFPSSPYQLGYRGAGRGKNTEQIRSVLAERGIDYDAVRASLKTADTEDTDTKNSDTKDTNTTDTNTTDTKDTNTTDTNTKDNDNNTLSAPIAPEPIRQVYQIYDNVLAKWRTKEWYLAHVTGFVHGRYNVYFMDGNVKINMKPENIRPLDVPEPPPRRGDIIGLTFYDSGGVDAKGVFFPPGRWKVRRMVDNEYVCCRLSGHGKNMANFDIGHVIRQVQNRAQEVRELGPTARATRAKK